MPYIQINSIILPRYIYCNDANDLINSLIK